MIVILSLVAYAEAYRKKAVAAEAQARRFALVAHEAQQVATQSRADMEAFVKKPTVVQLQREQLIQVLSSVSDAGLPN